MLTRSGIIQVPSCKPEKLGEHLLASLSGLQEKIMFSVRFGPHNTCTESDLYAKIVSALQVWKAQSNPGSDGMVRSVFETCVLGKEMVVAAIHQEPAGSEKVIRAVYMIAVHDLTERACNVVMVPIHRECDPAVTVGPAVSDNHL